MSLHVYACEHNFKRSSQPERCGGDTRSLRGGEPGKPGLSKGRRESDVIVVHLKTFLKMIF